MKLKLKKSFTQSLAENFKLLLGYALGLVAALAWNDAIQSFIKTIFPKESLSSLLVKFIYAIIITVLAVIVIFLITKLEKIIPAKLQKTKKQARRKNG